MLRVVRDDENVPEEDDQNANVINFYNWRIQNEPGFVYQEIERLNKLAAGHLIAARGYMKTQFRLVK